MTDSKLHDLADSWRQLFTVIKDDDNKALRLLGLDAVQIPQFVDHMDTIAASSDQEIVFLMLPVWLDWQKRGEPEVRRGTYVSMGDTLCWLMKIAGEAVLRNKAAKEAADHA